MKGITLRVQKGCFFRIIIPVSFPDMRGGDAGERPEHHNTPSRCSPEHRCPWRMLVSWCHRKRWPSTAYRRPKLPARAAADPTAATTSLASCGRVWPTDRPVLRSEVSALHTGFAPKTRHPMGKSGKRRCKLPQLSSLHNRRGSEE